MRFDTAHELSNHKKKFCIASDYGSIAKLEQQFGKVEKAKPFDDPDLNIAAINDYLKGQNASVIDKDRFGNLSLEDLRKYFQDDHETYKQLMAKAELKREHEVASQLDNIQKEKQMLKLQNNKDDQEMTELMKVLEDRKEKELRAKIEKEKIRAELQAVDRSKLNYMEDEKQRELERLGIEREALRKKEEDLMNEISGLHSRIQNREEALTKEREELRKKKGKGQDEVMKEDMRKKEMEFARERGERVAELKHKREMLELEKGRIMEDLELIKKGNVETVMKLRAKPSLAIPKLANEIVDLNPEARHKLMKDKARIEELKASISQTKQELLPETDEFNTMKNQYKDTDIKRMTKEYISSIEEKNKDNPKKLVQDLGAVRSHLEYDTRPGLGNAPPINRVSQREGRGPALAGLSQLPGYKGFEERRESIIKSIPLPKPTIRGSILPIQHEESDRTPPPPAGSQYPPQIPQINPPPYMPPMYPGSMYQPVPQPQASTIDPLLLQDLSEIKDKIGKSVEKNRQLASELQQLKESKVEQRPISKVSHSSVFKKPQFPAAERGFAQNEKRAEDLEAEEKALINLAAQEFDTLQLLTSLDPESELYQYKLQQYKDTSAYRAEIEKALQKQRLEKLKFDFDVQKKRAAGGKLDLEDPGIDENAVEQAKRDAIMERLKSEFQTKDPEAIIPSYSPMQGFNIGLDFALNLPADVAKLQAVYGIFLNGVPVLDPQQAGPILAKIERDKAVCIMSFNQLIKDIPPLSDSLLIVELQGIDRSGTPFNFGWTFVDLFDVANNLKIGLHKLPILKPPTLDRINFDDMSGMSRLENACLYVRVNHPSGDYISNTGISPLHKNMYTVPECHKGIPNDGEYVAEPQQMISLDQPAPNMAPVPQPPITRAGLPFPPVPGTRGLHTPAIPQINPPVRQTPPALSVPMRPGQLTTNRPRTVDKRFSDMKGINVHIHNLKNVPCLKPFKLGVSLLENYETFQQPNGDLAHWESHTILPPVMSAGGKLHTAGGTIIPRSEPTQNITGVVPLVPINTECEFVGNIYRIRRDKPGNPEFHLLVQRIEEIEEKIPTTGHLGRIQAPQTTKMQVTSYAVMRLHNEDESINFGDYQFPIFNAPVTMPPNGRPTPGNVIITVSDLKGIKPSARPTAPIALPPPQNQKIQMKKQPYITPIEENKEEQELFIENIQDVAGVQIGGDEGFIIFIDSMRFIPETCGLIKMNMRGYSSTLSRIGDETILFPELDSSVCMPIYKKKKALIINNINPSLIMIASLEVYDAEIKKDRILGLIGFNLFIDPSTHKPISQEKPSSYYLNEGMFQLPIYCEFPFSSPFTVEKLQRMNTVPAASVLIRIKKLPRGERDLLYDDPPDYRSGKYITNYHSFSPLECRLMEERNAQPSKNLMEVARSWRISEGMRTEIREIDMLEWLSGFMRAGPRTDIFDYKFYDTYNSSFGLTLSIEGFHNAPTNLPIATLCSFNPPGEYYKIPRITENTFMFSSIDFTSPQKSMQYSDEAKLIKIEEDITGQIIFDICSVSLQDEKESIISWGWSILPLFEFNSVSSSKKYVNTGLYMLPIYKGPVPTELLPDLAKHSHSTLYPFLNEVCTTSTKIRYVEPMSIIVMLKDVRYTNLFVEPFEYKRFNKSAIPKDKLSKYDFNISTAQRLQSAPKYSALVGSNQSQEDYQSKITAAAAKFFGLQ